MRANGPDAAFAAGATSVSIPAITAIVFPCLIKLGDFIAQLRFAIARPVRAAQDSEKTRAGVKFRQMTRPNSTAA
jgi:hypothetical protein